MTKSSLLVAPLLLAALTAPQSADAARGRVEFDAHTGVASLIEGSFAMRAPASDPVAVAREFLASQTGVTGIRDIDAELKVTRVIPSDELGMSHVRFQQVMKGIPVFGADLWVHMKGNVVTSMNGVYMRSPRIDVRVEIQGDDAAELAMENLKDKLQVGLAQENLFRTPEGLDLDSSPVLSIYNPALFGEKGAPVLAWNVSVDSYQYFINARNGAVVDAWDNVHHALKRTIWDAMQTTTLPGVEKVCTEATGCSNRDTDTNLAFDQFKETWEYFKNVHSYDSYDGKGGELIGTVHYNEDFVNAFWNGSQMVFGDNMVANDVTAHELGHGVCQYTAGLVYKKQSGALNEAYSDIWGASVDDEDWLMGEDLYIGAIRSLENPSDYSLPEDMDEYKNYLFYDNGGVHINMGIPSYAFYLLAAGGTHKGVTVVGQGRSTAEKIMWRTEYTKLTSSSKFLDWANLAISACGELYGANSATCQQTTQAMKATKIIK